MKRPKLLFFDVNETLLDLSAMKTNVAQALDGRADLLPLWFTTMLQYSLVATVGDNYDDFGEIGAAAMIIVAHNNGVTLSQEAACKALLAMRSLPPHPDVPSGLDRLKQAGFRMVTLTNSSQAAVDVQIKNAELMDMFEVRLSIEEPTLQATQACLQVGCSQNGVAAGGMHAGGSTRLGYRWSPLGGLARCFPFPAGRSTLSIGTRTGNRGTGSDRSGKAPDRAGEVRRVTC